MFDDSGDDADCDSLFFVQTGNGKADIIFLARCTQIIAGVGNGIDAVIEPDVDNAAPHIGDPPGIPALGLAFLHIVQVCGRGHAAHISGDGQALQTAAVDGKDTDQDAAAHTEMLAGIAQPLPGEIPRHDSAHLSALS